MSLLMFSRLSNQPHTSVRRAVAALGLKLRRVGNVCVLTDADVAALVEYFAAKRSR
jgi:hypothetical protein